MVLAQPAIAGDWTTADTGRQALVIGLSAADWAQTLYVVRHPCGRWEQCTGAYQESGPAKLFIGGHPSVGQVDNYFASAIALDTAIAVLLPPRWRPTFQYGSAAFEAVFVIRNRSVGIKFAF